jgi:hypothetical protein
MGAAQTFGKYVKAQKREKNRKPGMSLEERRALHKLRTEAKKKGTILASAGRGGLSPSLVLAVFRRDDYQCKIHGDRGEGEHRGIQLHHKGGIVESEWLSKKGHKGELNNLVTLCSKAHDELHTKARDEGVDSSQIKPKGD